MAGPSPSPAELAENVERVRERMVRACERSGRTPDAVTLVAVTKTFPVEVVQRAARIGLRDFGENHANDLAEKAKAVPARWHFLGKLQAGTAPRVADHAAVIHSAEPGRALERVANRAARTGRTIETLLQVDFSGERQGVGPDRVEQAAEAVGSLDGVELVGLMTLPPLTSDLEATRGFFRTLRRLRDGLRERLPQLCELSMGMSGDFECAIEEGATMVRVGTALFGVRPRGGEPANLGDRGR
jgi:pyridoxal phosphate enzyme (YggS family)